MCEIAWLPKLLVWSFLGVVLFGALVSRKLNDHLLVPPPPQPAGPFGFLLRRKYHIRPQYLLAPSKYFDGEGQGWARLLVRLLAFALGLLIAALIVMRTCGADAG